MVSAAATRLDRDVAAAWQTLKRVMDPEIPVVSVVNLGIVRDVHADERGLEVVITPTYTGCPATQVIESEIRRALDRAGLAHAKVTTALHPAWTTDWIDEEGRRRLEAFGIAPPERASGSKRALFGDMGRVECPHCGSRETELLSEFGSTPCKALHRCLSCREPFDAFKCL